MKKVVCLLFLLVCFIPICVEARSGCCSHHGGVAGCSGGRQVCNDGTLSPTCTCGSGTGSSGTSSRASTVNSKPTYNYGCTDRSAINYDSKANKDNGSCIAKKYGCMDKNAINFDSNANVSNYDCQYKKIIVVKEKIEYDTVYKNNKEMNEGDSRQIKDGKNGEREITYDAIVDSNGDVVSKEVISEKVISLPSDRVIEKGTREVNAFWGILWIIGIIINFYHASKYKNGHLLLNKIGKQEHKFKIMLYILYVVLIIPIFIDLVIIVVDWGKYLYLKNKLSA